MIPFRNYNAELYAFAARVGERFDDTLLRKALTDVGYAEAERERQRDLGILDSHISSNVDLAVKGNVLIRRCECA